MVRNVKSGIKTRKKVLKQEKVRKKGKKETRHRGGCRDVERRVSTFNISCNVIEDAARHVSTCAILFANYFC
jgi:hypothetical protein